MEKKQEVALGSGVVRDLRFRLVFSLVTSLAWVRLLTLQRPCIYICGVRLTPGVQMARNLHSGYSVDPTLYLAAAVQAAQGPRGSHDALRAGRPGLPGLPRRQGGGPGCSSHDSLRLQTVPAVMGPTARGPRLLQRMLDASHLCLTGQLV